MLKSKKITVLFIFFFAAIFLLSLTFPAHATDVFGINDFASSGVNLGTKDLKETIAGIVNIFLGFLGILTTLIILYGGFIWMTSQGNADKIDRAKKIIINGVIGLIIVLSSYAIARYILREGYDNAFGTSGSSDGGDWVSGVGLGTGALEGHYPGKDAVDVPRNTNIYLTFKEPIDIAYMVEDTGCTPGVDCVVNTDYMELFEQGNPNGLIAEAADLGSPWPIIFTPYDSATGEGQNEFFINPYGATTEYLGSPSSDVGHTVQLGNIQTLAGTGAFVTGGYSWNFIVGTELDLTPPTVTSVSPADGSVDNPKNSVVRINFSEAVDPISSAGFTADGFDNIIVRDSSGVDASGRYVVSNQYRTAEFITDEFCGENSCGGEVFCLPVPGVAETFTGLVSGSAPNDLIPDREEAIVDMAGNVLDCAGNCDTSNYYIWSFQATDTLDLDPPYITHMQDITDVDVDASVDIEFSEELLFSSVNSSNIFLDSAAGALDYWTGLTGGNVINIYHSRFAPTTIYTPTLTSGIKDARQNCWYPCLCQAGDNSCTCTTPTCSGGLCAGTIGTP